MIELKLEVETEEGKNGEITLWVDRTARIKLQVRKPYVSWVVNETWSGRFGGQDMGKNDVFSLEMVKFECCVKVFDFILKAIGTNT